MSDKETYCKTLEDCLEKWTERIVELETAVDKAEGPARVDCCNQIDTLKSIGGQMKAKLEEIKKAEGSEWDSLRESAEKIKKELEESIDFPISRFP